MCIDDRQFALQVKQAVHLWYRLHHQLPKRKRLKTYLIWAKRRYTEKVEMGYEIDAGLATILGYSLKRVHISLLPSKCALNPWHFVTKLKQPWAFSYQFVTQILSLRGQGLAMVICSRNLCTGSQTDYEIKQRKEITHTIDCFTCHRHFLSICNPSELLILASTTSKFKIKTLYEILISGINCQCPMFYCI